MASSQSRNREWGFFGTLKSNFGVSDMQAAKLFDLATSLLIGFTETVPEMARDFMDSTYGRHFADGLTSYIDGRYGEDGERMVTDHYRKLVKAIQREITTDKRHLKEFQRFVREFQAEETSEFGESKFNKLVQRVLETKG